MKCDTCGRKGGLITFMNGEDIGRCMTCHTIQENTISKKSFGKEAYRLAKLIMDEADNERKPVPFVKPTDAQISDACSSYDHSYGLMSEEEKKTLRFEAKEWFVAWQKTIKEGGFFQTEERDNNG